MCGGEFLPCTRCFSKNPPKATFQPVINRRVTTDLTSENLTKKRICLKKTCAILPDFTGINTILLVKKIVKKILVTVLE